MTTKCPHCGLPRTDEEQAEYERQNDLSQIAFLENMLADNPNMGFVNRSSMETRLAVLKERVQAAVQPCAS